MTKDREILKTMLLKAIRLITNKKGTNHLKGFRNLGPQARKKIRLKNRLSKQWRVCQLQHCQHNPKIRLSKY